MALATRPRPTTHHKKRHARHHRHSPGYLKTYWPYLPMLAIVGAGVAVNNSLYSGGFGLSSTFAAGGPAASTRISAMTGQAGWGLAAVVFITAAAAAVFTFSHWYRIRSVVSRGETFAISHPWFDILLVLVLTSGVVLTRNIA